jgi:hypothetical protein
MITAFHSGDMGDCIACLPTIRQLGGGRLILGNRNGVGAREPMTKARFDVIAPLLAAQEYITEVVHQDDPSGISHDFHHFRTKPPPQGPRCGELGYNLATWQANWFGVTDVDLSPWLKATPDNNASWHKAVFARSLRYQNTGFDWKARVQDHSPAVFVGLQEEWANFQTHDCKVIYAPTSDLLQVAGLILGSDIFIGNQSAPCWIALGLGHPLIQEMDQWRINRNSVIERENAQYIG